MQQNQRPQYYLEDLQVETVKKKKKNIKTLSGKANNQCKLQCFLPEEKKEKRVIIIKQIV